jgi:hypothetical protein
VGFAPFANKPKKTNNHLFVYCRFTVRIWELLKDWLCLHGIIQGNGPELLVVFHGGGHESSPQGLGFPNFANRVGDLKGEERASFST